MVATSYKIGKAVFRVLTPEKPDDCEPYSLFLCEDTEADAVFAFDYISEIPPKNGRKVYSCATYDVYDDSGKQIIYYHDRDIYEDYAYRFFSDEDKITYVYFHEKYRGQLWTRLIFDLISIDDAVTAYHSAVLHSSYIDFRGKAILFTAPCGTGKSTQAELWRISENAEVINGDKSLLYAHDGIFEACGLPFSGSSKICKKRNLPILAIVRLGQAKNNIIRRLSGVEAFKAVYEGCYQSGWNSVAREYIISTVSDIASNIPVYRLDCLPDESAVKVLKDELERTIL